MEEEHDVGKGSSRRTGGSQTENLTGGDGNKSAEANSAFHEDGSAIIVEEGEIQPALDEDGEDSSVQEDDEDSQWETMDEDDTMDEDTMDEESDSQSGTTDGDKDNWFKNFCATVVGVLDSRNQPYRGDDWRFHYSTDSLDDGLKSAIMDGDVKKVKSYFSSSRRHSTKDIMGLSLMYAIEKKNSASVSKLLTIGGMDVKYRMFEGGDSPLQEAASSGSAEIVKILLDHGANPNQQDYYGWIAMHSALGESYRENNLEIAALLLEAGTDLNKRYASVKGGEDDGECFDPACDCEREECDKMIVNRSRFGFDVHTLLHYVAMEGNVSSLKFLLEQEGSNAVYMNCQGQQSANTPTDLFEKGKMHMLCSETIMDPEGSGNLSIAELYLGTDIGHAMYLLTDVAETCPDEVGVTPLMMSLIFKRQEIFDVLMEFGADCNWHRDKDKCLPLHHALRLGNSKAAEVLLKKMDPHVLEKYGKKRARVMDIFSLACKNSFQSISLLLEKGFTFETLCSWTDRSIGGVLDICFAIKTSPWHFATPFVSMLVHTEPKLANYKCCLPLTLLLGSQCDKVLPNLTKFAAQGMQVNPPPNSDSAPTLPTCHMTYNADISDDMWLQIFSFLEENGFDPDYTSCQNSIGFPDMLVCASMNNARVLAFLLRFSRNTPVALLEKWTCFLAQLERNGNRLTESCSALFAKRMKGMALVCTTLGIPSTQRVKVKQFEDAVKAVTGVESDWDHIYSGMDPVPPLQQMCRTTVRSLLSERLSPGQLMKDAVEGFKIPALVASFLLYKDIEIMQFLLELQ